MTPEQLKADRESVGLSRTQLAAAIGRSERSIYRYENGERPIDQATEMALTQVLAAHKVRGKVSRKPARKTA